MLGSQCDQIEIGTRAAIHAVDAVPTAQDVVTAAAIDLISVCRSGQNVCPGIADHGDTIGQCRSINIESSRTGSRRRSACSGAKNHPLDATVARVELQGSCAGGRKSHFVNPGAAAIGDFRR